MADKLGAPEDILLLFELNWRLERCMMPLFLNWVNQLVPIVNRYQPFDASDNPGEDIIVLNPGIRTFSGTSSPKLGSTWYSDWRAKHAKTATLFNLASG